MRQLSRAAAAIALVVVVQGFLASTVSAALAVQVGDELDFVTNLGGSYGGGEFLATVDGGPNDGFSFKTFCIELGQGLANPSYISAITTVGLNPGTALLYSQFWNGNLAGYAGTSGDDGDQTALQLAIWKLQGQLEAPSFRKDAYDANAQAQGYVASVASAVGDYGVRILKLVDANGNATQDVLIVPEPASILAWSLIGGCFVAGHRIRRNKRALV